MRYDAEIRVFDMLDQVMVNVRLWSTDGLSHEPPALQLQQQVLLPGVGESDPRQWLVDSLVALLEST
jgi:hypothetical protein